MLRQDTTQYKEWYYTLIRLGINFGGSSLPNEVSPFLVNLLIVIDVKYVGLVGFFICFLPILLQF